MLRNAVTSLALSAFAIGATGGTISEAVISGQVQQLTNNGAVTGCGFVLQAMEKAPSLPKRERLSFTGSFTMMNMSGGVVKGSAAITAPKSNKPQEVSDFWLKAPGAKPTSRPAGKGLMKSDDPGYILYVTDIQPLLALSDAIISGKHIQIGFKPQALKYEVILDGVVRLTEDQQRQYAECLDEWVSKHSEMGKGGD